MRTPLHHAMARVTLALIVLTTGCAAAQHAASAPGPSRVAESADALSVRSARAAQNRAIAHLDTATIASYWTDDVEIRRGLGVLVTGKEAYKQLFRPDSAAVARGEELIYQREPAQVMVSAQWPLAYEEGTWIGHVGSAE